MSSKWQNEETWSGEAQAAFELHIPHQGFGSSNVGQAMSSGSTRHPAAGAQLLPHRPSLAGPQAPPAACTALLIFACDALPRGSSAPILRTKTLRKATIRTHTSEVQLCETLESGRGVAHLLRHHPCHHRHLQACTQRCRVWRE